MTCRCTTRESTNIRAVNPTCPLVLVNWFLFFLFFSSRTWCLMSSLFSPWPTFVLSSLNPPVYPLLHFQTVCFEWFILRISFSFSLYCRDKEFHKAVTVSVNTVFVFLFKVFPDDMLYRATPTHAHSLHPLIAAFQTLLNVILKALISL